MPIVNACLGGLANAIPSGQAKLNLTWITNDGENQQVTFVISGTASKSIQSDANGYASVQLPVGTYTVSVTHGGEYLGDDPKSITLTSRGTFSLTWLTGARQAQTVVMNSPGAITSSSVSYSITLGGTSVASGSSWSASMTFSLYPGEYTLTVSAYGDSFTKTFTVPKTSGLTLNLSEFFCNVTVSSSYSCRSISYRGYSVPGTSSYASSHSFYVIRASSSRSIGGTVNTPTPPRYSGASTDYVYTYSASSGSVTPSSAYATGSIPISRVTNLVFITSDGTLTVPSENYIVLINGGGGGREKDSYIDSVGAAGGEIKMYSGNLSGSYDITLGAGGTIGAGSASSFGTLLSASGGEGTTFGSFTTTGVAGGAGGRNYSNNAQFDGYRGGSTSGDIGGGGGGSGGASAGDAHSGGRGGSGGTKYGGSGGAGSADSNGNAGSDGTSVRVKYSTYTAYGGSGGSVKSYSTGHYSGYIGGGGGGGGGYGANGGRGGNGSYWDSDSYKWETGAGGGGGGALGGAGGDAANSGSAGHGRGYGSGAGGWSGGAYNGGGGGGGIGSTMVESSDSKNGAKGCVAIWWSS